MTNIDNGAILTNTDEITERLRAHLDRGGKFRFTQSFGNDESSTTIWKPVDAPFIPPTKLNGKRHIYWNVNPTFCTVIDE